MEMMESTSKSRVLLKEISDELHRIMGFWSTRMPDQEQGGFYGEANFHGIPDPKSNKGIILNARILWSFSAAYNTTGATPYKDMARRAWDALTTNFEDTTFGGYFWETDFSGKAIETRKQTYAQAFVIYAFSEYYKASHQNEVLDKAISLFQLLEQRTKDPDNGGYLEAFGREWNEIADVRLSEKDLNEPKSLNTHLHILEAYTALYQVAPTPCLAKSLRDLMALFPRFFILQNGHLDLFFDKTWHVKSHIISYGHDIETSWLLMEAADALKDPVLTQAIETVSLNMVKTFANEGIDHQGGITNEKNTKTGTTDTDRHWWVHIEATVGLIHAYKRTGDKTYLETALSIWEYIKTFFLDFQYGEWHWLIRASGEADTSQVKAGFWKCPYHNSRGCMEITRILSELSSSE